MVSKLHEILRPFLLRRLKKDVLLNMPPKKEVVIYTPMSLLQRDYYALAYEGKLRDKLLSMGLSGGRDCSQININMNLRKVTFRCNTSLSKHFPFFLPSPAICLFSRRSFEM